MVAIQSRPQHHCQLRLARDMSLWVYILGEKNGEDVKVGHSTKETMRPRVTAVTRLQTTPATYVLLAAVHATTKEERLIKEHFADLARPDKGSHGEYFWPEAPIVEYANWLRSQWYSTIELDERRTDVPMQEPELWLPDVNSRRVPPPPRDELKLVQDYEDPSDPFYNTAWSWVSMQKAGTQDYFTPTEIVDAARQAMGGIDLDAAGHPLANRTHKIPDYFHTGRSAFDNDWHGRVWLNPPYGNNAPWFERILRFVDNGEVEQICMLSPMWAFQTKLARPMVERASGLILLSPTPKFWGNVNPDKTGRNDPHGIVYIGPNSAQFNHAFASFGFPMRFAWSDVAEFIPADEQFIPDDEQAA